MFVASMFLVSFLWHRAALPSASSATRLQKMRHNPALTRSRAGRFAVSSSSIRPRDHNSHQPYEPANDVPGAVGSARLDCDLDMSERRGLRKAEQVALPASETAVCGASG